MAFQIDIAALVASQAPFRELDAVGFSARQAAGEFDHRLTSFREAMYAEAGAFDPEYDAKCQAADAHNKEGR